MSPNRLPRLLRTAVAAVAVALLASGCKVPTGGTQAVSEATTTHDLAAVKVAGDDGDPRIDVPHPFSVDETTSRVVSEGDGATVGLGQQVTFRYTAVNGTDGQPLLDKTWKGDPTTVILGAKGNMPGLDEGLRSLKVGSTALVAIPPDAGYGVKGNPGLGVGPTDTIVCLVEVLGAQELLTKAEGKAVAPKKGLPTVKRAATGVPTVTLPSGAAPSSLVVQPLVTGSGPAVAKGDLVTVQYVGVVWPGGRVYDSSWTKEKPLQVHVGTGETIAGWDGLLGQKVGSQVMLVVPPDKAYGAEGNDKYGVKATDTLVFVIDVLGTRKPL